MFVCILYLYTSAACKHNSFSGKRGTVLIFAEPLALAFHNEYNGTAICQEESDSLSEVTMILTDQSRE